MLHRARLFHCYAVIGGIQLPVLAFSCEQHAYAGSDEASLTLPMTRVRTGGGQASQALDLMQEAMTPGAGGKTVIVPVQIYAGYPTSLNSTSGLVCVFDGMLDGIQESYHEDIYQVTARSFAYVLQQDKVSGNFRGQTTVQMIQSLVQPYGFTLKADPSSTLAGKALGQDTVQEGRSFRAWDLITNFAQKEGREVWMQGTTLYYTNKNPDSLKPAATFTWGEDLLSLEVHHQALFSHEVDVTVYSHDHRSGKTVTGKAKKKGKTPARSSRFTSARAGTREQIRLDVYGMTLDQANAYAQKVYEELSAHELVVEAETAGNPTYSVHRTYAIAGASPMVNQSYHPKVVRHEFSQDEGYRCHFTLINHPVYTVGLDLGTSAGVQN